MAKQILYLIRHGETPWTLSRQHTGRTDLALTRQGENQAGRLKPRLSLLSFAAIFSSPLQRAKQTATLSLGGREMTLCPFLVEWDYGKYEGKTTAEIRQEKSDWNLFIDGAPGGESPDDVAKRITQFFHLIESISGPIAVFAHGHLLRSLTALWLGLPIEKGASFALDTASLSILSYEKEHRALFLWNDRSHLQ